MRKIYITILTCLIFLSTFPVFAQSPKDAIKALKKVETLTKTNIYGRDYLNAYAEAQAEVDMYLVDPKSSRKPALKKSIEQAALAYKWAGNIWSMKMKKEPYVHESSATYKALCVDFPDAKESLKGTVQMDEAIGWLYGRASKEISTAMTLLYK